MRGWRFSFADGRSASKNISEREVFTIILAVHLSLCIFMIVVVLLQQGQGADAGVTFGGGSSSSFFGAGGGVNFFTRLTTFTCILFMVTSILLIRAYALLNQAPHIASNPLTGSVMEGGAGGGDQKINETKAAQEGSSTEKPEPVQALQPEKPGNQEVSKDLAKHEEHVPKQQKQ